MEPKTNRLQLHDLRVRRLAERLSDPLRPGAAPLRYTADQLRMAASRKILAAGPSRQSGWTRALRIVGVAGGFLAFAGLVNDWPALFVVAVVGVLVGALICLIGHDATAARRSLPGEPMTAEAFTRLLTRWEEVYREPPPGLIRPGPVPDRWPSSSPVALLYCADVGTAAFLAASGIVERRGVALISGGPQLPPASLMSAVQAHPAHPVLVLHDADPAGCLVAPRLRAVLPPGTRVVDAGLRPRDAARAGPPVRRRPDRSMLDELALAGSVDSRERAWLMAGNTYPLAAMRPARLLAAVERAVSRIDPEEERAAGVGFMAWPERSG